MLSEGSFVVSFSQVVGSDIGIVDETEHWSDNYYATAGSQRATMCCNCDKVEAGEVSDVTA